MTPEGPILYRHSGTDFLTQAVLVLVVLAFFCPLPLFFDRVTVVPTLLACALVMAGWRASITVWGNGVRVDKWWFFIRYRRYEGTLDRVRFSGDWADRDKWFGMVCVDIGKKEIGLGGPWNQQRLYRELAPFAERVVPP